MTIMMMKMTFCSISYTLSKSFFRHNGVIGFTSFLKCDTDWVLSHSHYRATASDMCLVVLLIWLPPLKEVMFLVWSVCLSVCPSDNWKKLWTDFDEISYRGRGRAWPKDQRVQFWWRSGSPSGSRSPKSDIRIHWIIEKVTNGFWWNFMESWGVV